MFCIICGCSEHEVQKLFCFPRQLDRSNSWQRSMGMMTTGILAPHIRICNRHFSPESFVPCTDFRLKRDAVPTLFPAAQCLDRTSTASSDNNQDIQPCCEEVTRENLFETNQSISDQNKQDEDKSVCTQKVTTDSCCSRPTKKRFLSRTLKSKVNQLRKLQKECKKRGHKISELLKRSGEMEALENMLKHLPATNRTFVLGQIRSSRQLPRARRWTMDEKVIGLALYKRSPKCYALLQRITALPSKDTLNKVLRLIPFETGINSHIFKYLGQSLVGDGRYCTIVFDEMAIREHIFYDKSRDCITGVEDLGNGKRSNQVAKYALVFMLQGVCKTWKQPLAYYFSRNGVSAATLENILREILDALHLVNIPVIATICDMGTTNVKALQNMGSTCDNPCITIGERQIFNIYDAPHLLKCTRNLFRSHNVVLPTLTMEDTPQCLDARWSDIVAAYEEDKKNPLIFRCLHKLKDSYLAPVRQTAMKVKVAAQIMSRTTSVYLYNLVKQNVLPSRAIATATFVNEVDEMFDSLNGSAKTPPDGKPYRCIVTQKSEHQRFWEECSNKVKKWRYIRKAADITNPHPWKPPSQRGWITTLNAFIAIQGHLNSLGIHSFKPRSLNQDALENLFGCIRAGCGLNENPTVSQFVSSLKTQVLNGLSNQPFQGRNCEDDELTLLTNFRTFLNATTKDAQSDTTATPEVIPSSSRMDVDQIIESVECDVGQGTVNTLSAAYVAGFIHKSIFKHFSCEDCYRDLSGDDLLPCNQFIASREFSQEKSKLAYPSEQLVTSVGCAVTLLEDKLISWQQEVGISRKASVYLHEKLDFKFLSCEPHRIYIKKCVIDSTCKIAIPWYCKRVVRSIRTKSRQDNLDRKLKKLQNT